ncbi:MAG: aromatic-ring-hydroxylating dioxygenase subunit beta [Actinomycetota bacterium]|nr:aromatic-ring-hydroxylating dioxygenase subunit beta [Actinomycetota bacterium]
MTSTVTDALLLRLRIEDFLFTEAELLDAWKLDEWLALFEPDGRYFVPPTDRPDARDTIATAFIIADDHERLTGRVRRLATDAAWVERPRSRTHRVVGNVRVESGTDSVGDDVVARSSFIVHRVRRGVTDCFTGRYEHRLRVVGDSFRIRERWAVLTAEALQPTGKIGFIL